MRNKDKVIGEISNVIGKVFEEAENAGQISYKSRLSKEAKECPGAYSPRMTFLMTSDMRTMSLFLEDEDAKKVLWDASSLLDEKDIALRRMYDDMEDARPLTEYPFDGSDEIIRRLIKASKSGAFEGSVLYPDKEKVKAWVKRFLKVDIMAYGGAVLENIDHINFEAATKAFNDDGELVMGISDKDEKVVNALNDLKKLLVKALMRIDPTSDEVKPTMARIEFLDAFAKALVSGDKGAVDKVLAGIGD